MSNRGFFKGLLLAVISVTAASVGIHAQPTKPGGDPTDKPRIVKPELKNVYKKWLENDVAYIITNDEKKAFRALATDEERESFIENFWRRRDPDPDTEENEFREEYFERIAYANQHFASGIPGWKTDRGRIYIAWGKPDSIESHPSGGAYDRPSYEGGGSTSTYPFEIWFYRHLEGVGDGLEIEFVDRTGSGEYRLARDANEKDALLTIPGAGLTTSEMLGLSNKADRISGRNFGAGGMGYQREQDSPFRKLETLIALQRPPAVKFTDLQGIAGGDSGSILDKDPVDFDLRIDFFRQSDDRVITTFTVQTSNKELTFEPVGGLEQAELNIFGRITAVSGKRSGIFEDSVSTSATTDELTSMRDKKSIYQKAIALTPGTYKVDVVVRDVKSGNRGIRNLGFAVPRYDEKRLSTSSMVLTARLRPTDERDIGSMFVIGGAKVIPNLSGVFQRGQEVGVYMQVYNSEIDQTTLRPAVDVRYVLSKDGKELLSQTEDWNGLSDSGQRLTLARLLPTAQLSPGEYEIKILVKDKVRAEGQAVIENKSKFTITN